MTERVIGWFRRHLWVWIIAVISFMSGIGVLEMAGHSVIAILILIIVLVVAINVILALIDVTEGDSEKS